MLKPRPKGLLKRLRKVLSNFRPWRNRQHPTVVCDVERMGARAAERGDRAPADMNDAASAFSVTGQEVNQRIFSRPAEALEIVPGLVITQHSGDGKANQYFLRGFNLDHGTDLAIFLDGMPMNMPTHAHGQGYADLNMLIPELIARSISRKAPTSPTKEISPRPERFISISSTVSMHRR